MNVAILGAGLSGLACAITLEKHGITPKIFEKRSCPGDRFVNGEAMFSILNRPVKDCIFYLAEQYGIVLQPISEVNKLVIHSKNAEGIRTGLRLGFADWMAGMVSEFCNPHRLQRGSAFACHYRKGYEITAGRLHRLSHRGHRVRHCPSRILFDRPGQYRPAVHYLHFPERFNAFRADRV